MRAREFKAARERLGLSQAKLAKVLGMSVPMMNRYEYGKNRVPGVVALAIECLERRAREAKARKTA